MREESSIYRFFEELAGFLKAKSFILKEDIQGIDFEEEMKTVKKIGDNNISLIRKKPKTVLLKREEQKKSQEEEIEVSSMPEFMEGYICGISPFIMERLRRGDFSVQATLDLHGYKVSDAKILFISFIRDAVRSGLSCVKVIHGRGLRSKAEPSLKKALKGWMLMAMQRKWICAFASARMNQGGPGATVILLKRKPFKAKMKIVG